MKTRCAPTVKKSDAYTVFSKMLKRGHPPADWESLTQETEENH